MQNNARHVWISLFAVVEKKFKEPCEWCWSDTSLYSEQILGSHPSANQQTNAEACFHDVDTNAMVE